MNAVIERLWSLDNDLKRKDCGVDALSILNAVAYSIWKRKGEPLSILEIGTFHAYSALVFAQYGLVHTLDIRSQPKTQSVIDMFPEINKNIIRYVTYNQAAVRPLLRMFSQRYFDIIFVDGGHQQHNVEEDLRFVDGLSPIIFCHDHREVFPGTQAAINNFVYHGGYTFIKYDEEKTLGLCLLKRSVT